MLSICDEGNQRRIILARYVERRFNRGAFWNLGSRSHSKFGDAGRFVEGLAQVEITNAMGYIDRSGKLIIQPQFGAGSHDFSEEVADVEIEKRWASSTRLARS